MTKLRSLLITLFLAWLGHIPVYAETVSRNAALVESEFSAGAKAFGRKEYAIALPHFLKAANLGDAQAQYNVGTIYVQGLGVVRNDDEALKWFLLASEQGFPLAQSNLGWMYEQGFGSPQNVLLAFMWGTLGARSGDPDAIKYRDRLAKRLKPKQIAMAQKMAHQCAVKKFKGCVYFPLEPPQFADAATYFRSACPASLSEEIFRDVLAGADALQSFDTATPSRPFSIMAGLSEKSLAAFYYRSPVSKCCISMFNVSQNLAVSEMSRRLSLSDPRQVMVGGRTLIIFQPSNPNRTISIDWDRSKTTGQELSNICHTDNPNATAVHKSLAKFDY